MTVPTRFQRSLLTAFTALVLAPIAIAAGEPKNQAPFTRPALDNRSLAHATRLQDPLIQGERKNQLPFTRILPGPTAREIDYSDVFTRAVERHHTN